MTLIISWASVDDKPIGKSPAAVYIGSDSQYTWPNGKIYGSGQKTFCCRNSPELFGFCGDVLFSLNTINQLVTLIDSGCLFAPSDTAEIKFESVFRFIKDAFNNYPIADIYFSIIYATRSNDCFSVYKIQTVKHNKLRTECITLPEISTIITCDGSGSNDFIVNWSKINIPSNENWGTSRNVFYCLSESIANSRDRQTGGQPQIVGLYREGNGRIFGYVNEGKRFLYGHETDFDYSDTFRAIEWRNSKFERIDPQSTKPFLDTSKHYFRN